jgi:serine protease AprX
MVKVFRSGQRSWRLALAGSLAALMVSGTGALATEDTGLSDLLPVPVIIDGGGTAAVDAVAAVGGTVTQRLSIINGVSADVPAHAVDDLQARLPNIHVTLDVPVGPAPEPVWHATSDASTTLADVAKLVGADRLHASGITGKGVDVAIIDTGIAPVPGLNDPSKVVNGPDLSFDSQFAATRYLDTYGHGTNMASIIAADGSVKGVAPGARLLNVKVGAANGAVDVSQIIAAIDWVVQHRRDNGMNVRVLNLSLGTDGMQRAALDPLVHAVDVAWRAGIVVAAAVGNDGNDDGSVANPALNPNILAVGAVDSLGSTNPNDVVMAEFSSQGNGKRLPDLVAPGARVLGLRVPGSNLDVSAPAARRGDTLFRGSGTSQSTAVVSGAAALLLQQRPSLTAPQIKELLLGSARRLDESKRIAGHGLLDVAAAAAQATPSHTEPLKRMKGNGTLEEARGSLHVSANGVELNGERDIFGNAFDSAKAASARLAGASWSGGTWNGASWSGASWSGASWSGASWSGASWSGASWSGASWSGASWSGASWSGASWSGASWSGASWSGASWSGASWSGASWSGASWSGASWSGGSWYGNAWH